MVTNALIIHNKTKGKTKQKSLFCRIEIYYWILPNKSQTKIVIPTYNTHKNSEQLFPILKCNISYMNFLRTQQYLKNFISIREKVVLVSFFENNFITQFLFFIFS